MTTKPAQHGRGRTSADERPRVTMREAAVIVAEALRLDAVAAKLRRGDMRPACDLGPPELDEREGKMFGRALARLGIKARVDSLAGAITFDTRQPRRQSGRRGAPARDWLRREVRDLLASIERVSPDCDRNKVAALVLMMHGFDSHGVFWAKSGEAPPTGRRRVARVAKRLSDLASDGTGQYERRKKAQAAR